MGAIREREESDVLTDYIQAALRRTRCEWLSDDGVWYCEVPELSGVWATGLDEAAARTELRDALEGWIALGLALRHPFPTLDGVELRVALAG